MVALPPLNPADGALLARFLLSHENPLALLATSATNHTPAAASPDPSDPAPDLLTLLAFLARPDITPWLDHYHALQARARQNAAANILLEVLRDSTDPTQRRLAAAALMGQSRQRSRTLDRAVSPSPRSHAARPAAPEAQAPSPDAARHRHTLERPIPNPVPTPVPVQGASAPAQPAPPSPSDQQYPQPSTPGAHSPHHIPSLPPSSVPPCLSGSSSDRPLPPEPAMTLDQAMAVLGIRPELLDIADEIEDAALDGDLADTLEPAALEGLLGPDLQHASEQGDLEKALEEALDNGDHLADPAIANAFTAARQSASAAAPHEPDG